MANVAVVSQNAQRIVLEGTIDGLPELTERWTVTVDAIGADPGLLAQVRDELLVKLDEKLTAWETAQAAISNL